MKIEVVQLSKDGNFKVKIDGWIVFPNDYIGYESLTSNFISEEEAIDFAKKLANGKLVKTYPKTVFSLEIGE